MVDDFNVKFSELMKESFIQIPHSWVGEDLITYMKDLFNKFNQLLDKSALLDKSESDFVKIICGGLVNALIEYYSIFNIF